MKKVLFIFFASIFSLSSQNDKLTDVDKIMYSYSNINSIEQLTKRIDYDFKTDIEKVRAIFTWIALNIKYEKKDPYSLEMPKTYWVFNDDDLKRQLKRENQKTLRRAFRERKGVCKGYAFLFHEICTQLNIKNELVYGYVKGFDDIGYVPLNKNHVWNAVEVNNEWIFIDTTWGSGFTINNVWKQKLNTSYFNINKKDLRLTHYPSETHWLEYLGQKPLKDFCYQPIQTIVFTKSNAELVLPNQGIIKTVKNKNFKLKIKNLNRKTRVSYRYEDSKTTKSPSLNSKELITSINIRGTNKNSLLHIYFNNSLALSYRVEVK
jgi:transglutaminase/protease-like cytokinesis protein 3